ncbi:MAG: glutamate---cysteine ligase / carboxylate-amine ligase [Nocardioidaceae bacterium]|nr:glutamate---cysteine ligase / carboxylate-amine ligase [Nocardioidaceae bacterium]
MSHEVRTVGVEEELMLVDPASHRITAVASRALRSHGTSGDDEDRGAEVEAELYQQQIELATEPCTTLSELRDAIVRARRTVAEVSGAVGALAVAVPTPVLAEGPERLTQKPRYERIREEYGEVARQALVCGMHVHVEVRDEREAIAVVDGVRPWLPVLLALSANSPFMRGEDTGYASWRSQVWSRWPAAGPREAFDGPDTYAETGRLLQEWGAVLDEGMLYYDVRRAADWPTVELRVADVCTEVDDSLLVAALSRGLVSTLVADFRASRPLPEGVWRTDLLRAAQWRAARYGMASTLVHPLRRELAPAREVVAARALPGAREGVRIVPARFGAEAGMLGAAAIAFDGIGR